MDMSTNPRKARGIVAVRADASGDPKELAKEIKARIQKFQTEYDEKLAEVRGGFDDVVKTEKVDAISASIDDLHAKYEEAVKAAESAKAAEARMDELEKQAHRMKAGGTGKDERDLKAEARVFMSGKNGTPEARVVDVDVETYRAYDEQFPGFLKMGDRDHSVQAAMQVGSDPDGGYWVPTQMTNDIRRRLFETSPVRQVADVLPITTDSVSFPTDTNDATSGGWVGEVETRSETATPQIGEQTIYVREQYAEPRVTQKLLDMATIDVDTWLNAKIADKMGREENKAFVTGTGVNQPRGFLDYKGAAVTTDDDSRSWGILQYVISGASGGFPDASGIAGAKDADVLVNVIAKLKPAYWPGARWAMNRATMAEVRKLKDGDGRYLVRGAEGTEGGFNFDIHGFPITLMEDMPSITADSFSIAFGNFAQAYLIVDGRGIRILRDPFTAKPYVKFYTTKWTGGDVTNFDALKLVKFGTS